MAKLKTDSNVSISENPWVNIPQWTSANINNDEFAMNIASLSDEDTSERFRVAADIVENGGKRILAENQDVRVYSVDHAYCAFALLSPHIYTGAYEFARLLNEYDKRFIEGYFVKGLFFKIVGMTDRMDFTYADQVSNTRGFFVKSVFDKVHLVRAYDTEFKRNNKFGGVCAVNNFPYDSPEASFLFYVDKDNMMLRLPMTMSIPGLDFGDVSFLANKEMVRDLPMQPAGIAFQAVFSHPVVSTYLASANNTDMPDSTCVEAIDNVRCVFDTVAMITLPDRRSQFKEQNVVGYRLLALSEYPVLDDPNMKSLFEAMSPCYKPSVSSLGWEPFSIEDCHMPSVVHYLANIYNDKNKFSKNVKYGLYNDLDDPAFYKLAHSFFVISEMLTQSENYVQERAEEVNREIHKSVLDEVIAVEFDAKKDAQRAVTSSNDASESSAYRALLNGALLKMSAVSSPGGAPGSIVPAGLEAQVKLFFDILDSIDYNDMCKFVKKRVCGHDAAIDEACYYVWMYLKGLSSPVSMRDNFIIAGCSGCGKTEFMRTIKAYLDKKFKKCAHKMTVTKIDAANLSMHGYKGLNFDNVLSSALFEPSLGSGIGIVFLDELDKKLLPQHDSSGEDTNAAVQDNLLTAIEGSLVTLLVNGRNDYTVTLDTRNTLFIGLGTFESVRKEHEDAAKSSLGFTSELADSDDVYWQDISEADIIELGAKEEFLGRFSSIINFSPLDDAALRKILKLHISSKYSRFKNFGVKVKIKDADFGNFIKCAKSRRGVRAMHHAFDSTVQKGMIELLKQNSDMNADVPVELRIKDVNVYEIVRKEVPVYDDTEDGVPEEVIAGV